MSGRIKRERFNMNHCSWEQVTTFLRDRSAHVVSSELIVTVEYVEPDRVKVSEQTPKEETNEKVSDQV